MERETRHVDVAIIGAGTAGLNARREALKNGAKKVVLIESTAYGTTCARVGCMPSKVLIQAGDAAHELDRVGELGLKLEAGYSVDGKAVMERVRKLRERFAGGVVRSTEALPEEERLWGHAQFTGPSTLDIEGGPVVEAKAVVIATGSRSRVPPVLRDLNDRLLLSDAVFELEAIPKKLAVIGTGIIALELGQALARLGADTSFFSIVSQLGPLTDPLVQERARAELGEELDLHLEIHITKAWTDDHGAWLEWTDASGTSHRDRFDTVLAATGRVPNVENLGLETTGIALNERGIPLFDDHTMQCGEAPIFIAGDVNTDRPLLHEAADEGRLAGANAARFPNVKAGTRRTPLTVVFSDPQMAIAGASYAELDPDTVAIGMADYREQGRARIMAQNRGMVRVYADRASGKLLGAEMLGPRMENMSHLLAWAIQAGLTVQQALDMPFYHPVLEEGLRGALAGALKALRK